MSHTQSTSSTVSRAAWPVFALGLSMAILLPVAGMLGCAGGGPQRMAEFSDNTPISVIDVIDGEALRRAVDAAGQLVEAAGPLRPVSIAPMRHDALLIADAETRSVILLDGTKQVTASTVGPYTSQFSTRKSPRFVRTDFAGNIYAVDGVSEYISVYDEDLVTVTEIQPPYRALNLPDGQLTGLAFGGFGEMYVADRLNSRVFRFDASGVQIDEFGSDEAPWAKLNRPAGLACDDDDGSVYVCDLGERRVVVYDNNGALLRTFGQADLREPVAIAIDRHGQVFVADYTLREILVYSRSGTYLGSIDGPRLGVNDLGGPTDIAVHRGILYIADRDNQRIIKARYGQRPLETDAG